MLRHLAIERDAQQIASRLYDASQRTFHRGTIHGWKDVYTSAQIQAFQARYGHLLDIYRYPRDGGLPEKGR